MTEGAKTTAATDVPVSRTPADDFQIAEQPPTLGIRNGEPRSHVRGELREFVVL